MKPKTATSSFRLDKSTLEAIQEEAKKQNVSVNTMLNQLALTYANYDRPMKRFQMIKLPASTFRYILEGADRETIIRAGERRGQRRTPRHTSSPSGGTSQRRTAWSTSGPCRSTPNSSNTARSSTEGKLSVTLSHNFGANGSLFYLKHYVQAIFAPLGKLPKFSPDGTRSSFELQ